MLSPSASTDPPYPGTRLPLHTERPAVYLDQWVWIRLARANAGKALNKRDTEVLTAVREAARDGVAFPLSTTHYLETSRIKDPRQRRDLADVMAPISSCRSLRRRRDLVTHQLRVAMHEHFGRPTFRPSPMTVLGLGAAWAFRGDERFLSRRGVANPGEALPHEWRAWLRLLNQHVEHRLLAGPEDHEIAALRLAGYDPEAVQASSMSRVEWEQLLRQLTAGKRPSADELRVILLARELTHEYLEEFNHLLAEYGLNLPRVLGFDPRKARSARRGMVSFAEDVPSLKIAVDLKMGLFRDPSRDWTLNHLHDVDALSLAVPYCRVVITDRDVAARAHQAQVGRHHGTLITARLDDLVAVLPSLRAEAAILAGDPTGWDVVGPGEGFSIAPPPPMPRAPAA